jgi:hypothetical protein
MYGPSYIGWAPMGWYDCYRPYYDWAYRPYARAGFDIGWGWSGRVRPGEVDLRPWTFVTPNQLMNRHVDQASLTADLIRDRLRRDGNTGLVSSAPARFTRNEIRDPNAAVGNVFRRGIGSGTGREGSGSAADMTPFFRRDPELSNSIRERVVRARPVEGVGAGVTIPIRSGAPSGVPTPGTSGTLEGRVNRGGDGTIPRGGESPVIVRDGRPVHTDDPASGLRRGGDAPSGTTTTTTPNDWRRGRAVDGNLRRGDAPQTPAADTPRTITPDRGSIDRNRGNNDGGLRRGDAPSGDTTSKPATGADNWRGRAVGRRDDAGASASPSGNSNSGSRDVPRRIIDGIGGARIFHGETPSGDSGTRTRDSGSRDSGSRDSGSRDSGRGSGSSAPTHTERSSPPPSHSEPSHVDRSSPPPQSHDSGSHQSHNDGGGHSKKD